jgi:hypothetical protein
MSIFRVYFFDETGNELVDNDLNGKQWLGTGGGLHRDGTFLFKFRTNVTLADYASVRAIKGEREVTIADFPGKTKVGVKVWNGPESSEKFWLVAEDYVVSPAAIARAKAEK